MPVYAKSAAILLNGPLVFSKVGPGIKQARENDRVYEVRFSGTNTTHPYIASARTTRQLHPFASRECKTVTDARRWLDSLRIYRGAST